jgi:hypothetical protein
MEYFIAILMIWVLIFIRIFFKKIIFRKVLPVHNEYTFKLSSRLIISLTLTHMCIMILLLLKVLTNFHILFFVALICSILVVIKALLVLSRIENKIIISEDNVKFIKHSHIYQTGFDTYNIALEDIQYLRIYNDRLRGKSLYFCLKNGNVKKFDLWEYNSKYYAHQILKILTHFGIPHEKINCTQARVLKSIQ